MEHENYFTVGDLLTVAITFVVIAVAIVIGTNITGDLRADFTDNSAEYNATIHGDTALRNISSKLGLLATVIVFAILLGIVIRYMFVRFMN